MLFQSVARFLGQISTISSRIQQRAQEAPIANTVNGTYSGKFLSAYNQDAFLGIPYAQPPLGNLRFQRPVSLNSTWEGVRNAKQYGFTCYQNSNRTDMSEDCLTVNVIRPSNIEVRNKFLPVFVIIYGGGFYAGSSADNAYNPSNLVSISQNLSQPILAVSLNYRLDVWGFLSSPEIFREKNANAGLMDQRMALRWIQENIAAFGGDPKRITVWGVSAGAQSIGLHLHSFGGRNDGLFHAAIMESGGPVGTALQELAFYSSPFDKLLTANGCPATSAHDELECLRSVPSEEFAANKPKQLWNPIVDGDYLTNFPSVLTAKSQFIKVPLITGANTDEGTSFSSRTVTSDADISTWLKSWRSYNLSATSIARLSSIYGNYTYPPYSMPSFAQFAGTGAKWRKSAAIGGDIVMMSQRRKISQAYSSAGVKVWSYRFDTPAWNAKANEGANHGCEVAFTLQNSTETLGPVFGYEKYRDLSGNIGRAYVNFVNSWDPNDSKMERTDVGRLPYWPSYGEKAMNMVLNANRTIVEWDDWRKEGIEFINSISRELLA